MVSVIIPMYNASETIICTLRSVKDQTYRDLEVIVVDDGSTDNSAELVKTFGKENEGLKLKLLRQLNAGVSSARNAGIKEAKGEWVALLDSDDEWLPEKLRIQMEIVNDNPDIDFLATNRVGESMDKFHLRKLSRLTKISSRQLLYKMYFLTPTVIFKRLLINSVGYFDEKQKYCEDGNFFIRFCENNRCYLLKEDLVITGGGKANFGEKGLSGDLWKMEKGEIKNAVFSYQKNIINLFELVFIISLSLVKYFRRIILVKRRSV